MDVNLYMILKTLIIRLSYGREMWDDISSYINWWNKGLFYWVSLPLSSPVPSASSSFLIPTSSLIPNLGFSVVVAWCL